MTPLWFATAVLGLSYLVPIYATLWSIKPAVLRALDLARPFLTAAVPLLYLLGITLTSRRPSAIRRFVLELGEQPPPGRLRDALARALGDSSLELAFWLPDQRIYVGLDGLPFTPPDGSSGRAVTALERGGERLGALVYDRTLAEAPALVASVGAATALALENERLQAAVRAQLEEVRASRQRIVEAADAERRRVERDIHDGAQQRLMTLTLALRRAQKQLTNDVVTANAILEEAAAELNLAVAELRDLSRGIYPAILTDEGLGPALQALADRSSVPVRISGEAVGRMPPALEATAYFMVSEALVNAARYSSARSVEVKLDRKDGSVHLAVSDDGVGGADAASGSGLRGLADRVAAIGGTLVVDSPPGKGTRIIAEIPCG